MAQKTKKKNPEETALIKQGEQLPDIEIEIPKTLRTEYNFLRFPFFDLSKNSDRAKIRIEDFVDTKEGRMRVLWAVTRNVESKFPGDFEKRLHRAIEQVINISPKPVENPLRLGSLRQIAQLMGINHESGKNLNDIKDGFKNIVKATIETEGTYQLKESKKGKRFINDTFHLYDRVVFTGEELPDGKSADAVYLMLGSWYLRNINANYVVPLDWRFYNQLKGSIATRMYEFMNIHFFTALERGYKYIDMKYTNICDFFPLVRQDQKWKARKQLKQAHDSLIEEGFFQDVEWIDIITESKNWLLRYWIGPRARAEYDHNKSEDYFIFQSDTSPLPLPERRHKKGGARESVLPLDPDQIKLKEELTERGVSEGKADTLVRSYPSKMVSAKLEIFDYLTRTKSDMISKNPPGWLVAAIEQDFVAPPGFETREMKQKRLDEKAEMDARFQERLKRDQYQEWLNTPAEKKVYWDLTQWKKKYYEENRAQPSAELTAEKQRELIAALPTNEEKQKEIFGKVIYIEQSGLF